MLNHSPFITVINIIRNTTGYFLFFSSLLLSGCASVSPWQRGILAKPEMQLSTQPVQALFYEHAYGSREAASGSNAGSGGGCGCY
ncbi:MAG: DUF4266 domain-containing protein [Methylovulum sp.]|nr:DUF4266 domain-containing protein [Methylovulum sp.]TSA40282.1 MAG: DUF4266 domain-containing protein [Methylococcaceae bacterium]